MFTNNDSKLTSEKLAIFRQQTFIELQDGKG